jgi:sulfur carrier protein
LTVRVHLNGEPRDLAAGSTVADVMASLEREQGVAVAVDGAVIPRGAWPRTELREGASIEVVVAVQGG